MRKFLIYTGFLFSERLVFEYVVRIYTDYLVLPTTKYFYLELPNVSSVLSITLFAYNFVFIVSFAILLCILIQRATLKKTIHELNLILSVVTIVLTLFVILTERKLLAFSHRRMGPTLLGRNGAFQIVADLFKLLTKELFIIPRPTTVAAPVFLSLTFMAQLLFNLNFI